MKHPSSINNQSQFIFLKDYILHQQLFHPNPRNLSSSPIPSHTLSFSHQERIGLNKTYPKSDEAYPSYLTIIVLLWTTSFSEMYPRIPHLVKVALLLSDHRQTLYPKGSTRNPVDSVPFLLRSVYSLDTNTPLPHHESSGLGQVSIYVQNVPFGVVY